MIIWWFVAFREGDHDVLKRQHRSRFDFERDVHVERTAAGVGGVKVDFPCLTHAVGLNEMAFVVYVEAMISCQVFQVRDERRDVNDSHQ